MSDELDNEGITTVALEGDAAYVLARIMHRGVLDGIVAEYDWPEHEQHPGTPYTVRMTTPHGIPYRITIERPA